MAHYVARHAAVQPKASDRRHTKKVGRGKARHRGLKAFVGTVAAVAVLSGTAYGAGLYYFQDHFLPNTTVNGRDVSLRSKDEVAADISASTDGYETTLSAGDFGLTVKASDIDLTTDGETAATDALSQIDLYQWPYLALVGSDLSVDAGVSYDRQKLADVVGAAVDEHNALATQPEDATWTYDSETGSFAVKPEVAGDVVDKDTMVSAAVEGVDSLATSTSCDDAEVTPSRSSDDEALASAVSQANAMISTSIPLTYQGKVKATVGHDQLAQWVSIDDDLSVTLDEDAVASYVASTVAPAVNTEDDDYTYTVAKGDLANELSSSVREASGEGVEIPVTAKAKPKKVETTDEESSDSSTGTSSSSSSGTSGSYRSGLGSYVDVDLSGQTARLYDASGNVLWSSNIVSGNASEDRSTPTGTYQINSKSTDVTLVGSDEDGDGEPDYKSHVTYWMPFIGNSVGLHDATWRGSFGGSIYETNGSHGCVNLPYAKAQQLYGLVSVGTTVYVHY